MIYSKEKLVELARIHAKREEFHKKIESALSIIRQYYRHGKSYVACSGGKDSLVLAHLIVHHVDPDVIVFHWDHGRWLMPRFLEAEIVECIRSIPVRNLVIERFRYGDSSPNARVNYAVWYRAFYKTLTEFCKKHNMEAAFLGLRAEESHVRKRKASRVVEKHEGTGTLLVYPLFNWTWIDVWAYIITNNVRYPSIYDTYARYLGYGKVRLVTFFDKEFEGIGTMYLDQVLLWKHRNNP